jgi:hypothetical protein
MVTKQQKAAAARARAARHCTTTQAISNPSYPGPTNVSVAIETDSESERGCGYMGGVNHQFSDTGYDSGAESEWLGARGSGSDDSEDSVVELEGDELEENLRELRKIEAHAIALEAFPKYGQIVMKKSASEWKKAEKNRALGYTGNSQRTQQRRAKEVRDRTAFREEAKNS